MTVGPEISRMVNWDVKVELEGLDRWEEENLNYKLKEK